MKVVLIYPGEISSSDEGEEEFKLLQNYHMPLGILYVGQVLKENGHEVILYDHNVTGASIETILNWLQKINPEVIGFTALSANLPTCNMIAKQMKQWNPNLFIVYGGYAATFCAKELINNVQMRGLDPDEFVKKYKESRETLEDENILVKTAEEVLSENREAVLDYLDGKKSSIQYLLGQMMKKTKGKADPKKSISILK